MSEMGVVVVERVRDRPVRERRRPRRNFGGERDDGRRRLAALFGDEAAQDACHRLLAAGERAGEPVKQREARHRASARGDLSGGRRGEV
jgi:hypothetical protein